MKPSTQQFLRSFAAAHRAGWPVLTLRRSAAAEQCLRCLKIHGLVQSYGPLPPAAHPLRRPAPPRGAPTGPWGAALIPRKGGTPPSQRPRGNGGRGADGDGPTGPTGAASRRAAATRRRPNQWLRVELNSWPAGGGGASLRSRLQRRGRGGGPTGGATGSGRGEPRLQLVAQSSRRHQRRLPAGELRGRFPSVNTVALMETTRGIVTSREAERFRLGGWILAILHL